MVGSILRLEQVSIPEDAPIRFGTDGWRGIIGAEFTFNRLLRAAKAAAAVLHRTYGKGITPRIIVGYDRRFLAEQFAAAVAQLLASQGYQVWLSNCAAPTPAFSWAVKAEAAIGGLVITASHNPGIYAGLKVKGAFGGSVPTTVTQAIEAQLAQGDPPPVGPAKTDYQAFDPWPSYCGALRTHVDPRPIREAIASGQLQVCADVMHGVAAGGLERLLEVPIREFRRDRDPLFGGGAPEPIGRYLTATQEQLRQQHSATPTVCLVFDGDADRLAVIDGKGVLYTAQEIIPILIDHLARHSPYRGAVIKSISSSDLVARVAAHHGLAVIETPIGFKYIGDRMLAGEAVLLGAEESGGIGYGHHLPERDALLSALYLLQALVTSGLSIGEYYQQLQKTMNFYSAYDRVDLTLASLAQRQKLEAILAEHPFTQILDSPVSHWESIDGYKFHLADGGWLLIRFSGTEPLLRLYCQGKTPEQVKDILEWASQWAVAVAG
ncbi:phosphoglucomutase/phosphomannomutase family protein [Thermosynechococcus sichuanensis E542]|uniref:phosphoglucomutase/phosphomannomutase family protein n=1 Tax=Thermosynechococcus sichuanensis TaxID=3161974 RepID=UPI0015E50B42|nr:phosphoglucomutase/phosphomannomutase family protein [Thermosynechococcus vestitus]AXY68421.2 phosphoglucomutase/phosphomannomutase family protein [Thermosynechococcus vestitus E542]